MFFSVLLLPTRTFLKKRSLGSTVLEHRHYPIALPRSLRHGGASIAQLLPTTIVGCLLFPSIPLTADALFPYFPAIMVVELLFAPISNIRGRLPGSQAANMITDDPLDSLLLN